MGSMLKPSHSEGEGKNLQQDEIVNFTQMFAEDTELYTSVKNTEDIRFLQNDINRLEEWAKIWHIRFNATKWKVMHLGRENMHLPYHMTHNCEQITIEETSKEKDFEVYVDKDLNFNYHIQQGIAKEKSFLDLSGI